MRATLLSALFLSPLATGCTRPDADPPAAEPAAAAPPPPDTGAVPPPREVVLGCTLGGAPTCELGRDPELSVGLTNRTAADILLVGSLDGSEGRMRYPHCYFEVAGPDGRPLDWRVPRCGNTNPLGAGSFARVGPGEVFDPYRGERRCPSPQVSGRALGGPGVYRLRFVYSTRCDDIAEWAGDGRGEAPGDAVLAGLFRRVPRVEVRSNEFVLTVVSPAR